MRIGIIGDPHEPFCHPMYRRFCADTFRRFRVNHVHGAADWADNHAISYHETDPGGYGPSEEYKKAKAGIGKWKRAFPKITTSIGNHDNLIQRKAMTHGMPLEFLKSFQEIWDTPGWDWQFEHELDGVLYTHGTGCSGADAAIKLAIQRRKSCVIGHLHSWAGCKYHANSDNRIFGLSVGCGIDVKAYAFAYGKFLPVRPVLGCGIVIDGEMPLFVPMPCGKGERYHRSRAGKKRKRVLV